MSDNERRFVVDLDFEAAMGAAIRACREEGLEPIARIDIRDHFRTRLRHEFRRYQLLEVWAPELALELLRHDLAAGPVLPAAVALYELADGETAIVATDHLSGVWPSRTWGDAPGVADIAAAAGGRLARALARLQHVARRTPARDAVLHAASGVDRSTCGRFRDTQD